MKPAHYELLETAMGKYKVFDVLCKFENLNKCKRDAMGQNVHDCVIIYIIKDGGQIMDFGSLHL